MTTLIGGSEGWEGPNVAHCVWKWLFLTIPIVINE
jgi:hypothetical protein